MAAKLRFVIEAVNKSGSGINSAGKSLDGLAKKAKTAAMAVAAIVAADQVHDMAKLGATAERVEKRFAAFAEEAGGAEKILDAFMEGAGGAASEMEAMSSASRLLQMGLVEDAAGMERVVEMATRLGDQTQSVSDRIGDFAAMLANQSIPRLDNFGISSGNVRARIAELQEQTKGLSREAAFMQAVMEQGGNSLAKLGPRAADSMMAFERAEAQMANLRVEIGKKLAPAFSNLMQGVSKVIDVAFPLVDLFANLATRAADLLTSIPALGDAFNTLGDALNLEQAAKTADQLATLSDGAEVAEGTISNWSAKAEEMMANGASLGDVMRELSSRVNDTSDAFEEGGALADIFVDQQGIMGEAAQATGEIILANARNYGEYTTMIDRFNAKITDQGAKVSALTQQQFELQQQIQTNNQILASGEGDLFNYSAEMERVQRATEETVPAVDAANVAFMQMEAPSMGQIGADLESAAAAQAALREQQELSIATANRSAEAYANMAMSLKDATEQQIAQQLIGMLDPETMGAEAFMAATTEIGTSFGLMDEKSIALAENLPRLAEAIEMQVIPAQNADEALSMLVADAEDGTVSFDNIVAAMGPYPAQGEAIALSTQSMVEQIKGVEESSPGAVGGMDSMTTSAGGLKEPFDQAKSSGRKLHGVLQDIEGTWVVNVKYTTTGTPPPGAGGPGGAQGPPEFQHGGVIPGPVGQPIPIIAHGGEVVLNPYQQGAMGGPGGPPPPQSVTNYHNGGNTYVINDRLTGAVLLGQMQRQRRMSAIAARMG